MKKICALLLAAIAISSCNTEPATKKFTLHANIKNIADQQVFLEQLFFSQREPEVLDTAAVKTGTFTLSAPAGEEGLYRLRFSKQETGYIFINDRNDIHFVADANDMSLQGPDFNTPANYAFKLFLTNTDGRQKSLQLLSRDIDSLKKLSGGDSILQLKIHEANIAAAAFKNFILKTIDTSSDPVIAMFALGYTQGIDPMELKTPVAGLSKRFPHHTGIAAVAVEFNEMMEKRAAAATPQQNTSGKPAVGDIAPDITMTDTSGKLFSLSSLRGKYVLVDFWASWCVPCRGENPNVAANYNKFKNKNFTILGVSLDENRLQWLKAIRDDHLVWQQVSDLKGWSNVAVDKYGFDGIPYNVLLDPQGRIIGTSLEASDLGKKLSEVLR